MAPGAPVRATARALAKVDGAVVVVLVEGISDQIAVKTAAVGRVRDLEAERVAVVPIGGAHAIGRFLTGFGPRLTRVRLAGLCDPREAEIFRRGLVTAGVGSPRTRTDLEDLGFCVCVDDLEDELILAVGTDRAQPSGTAGGWHTARTATTVPRSAAPEPDRAHQHRLGVRPWCGLGVDEDA